MRRRPALILLPALLFAAAPAQAQVNPGHLAPMGGKAGSRLQIAFGGEGLPETGRLHVEGEGVTAAGPFIKGKGEIEIAADAAPGVRLLSLIGDKSVTTARRFAVGRLDEAGELEPNDRPAAATPLPQLPVTVNGSLPTREDVDLFRVSLKAGDCLVIAAEARALGAPTDLIVRVRDMERRELATQMDYRTRDPLLAFRAPGDGDYLVELLDVMNNYSAVNADYLYRVHLTTGPWFDYVFPAAVTAGRKNKVELHGWNLGGASGPSSVEQIVEPAAGAGSFQIGASEAGNILELRVSEQPEAAEAPGGWSAPHPLPIPGAAWGRLMEKGEEDAYLFRATKGERLLIAAEGRTLQSAADLRLAVIRMSDGAEVGAADDTGRERDPSLLWTAPATGEYRVVIRDVAGEVQGGPLYFYRLSVAPPASSLVLTAPAVVQSIKPGGELTVELSGRYSALDGPLQLAWGSLPAGVTAQPVELKTGSGQGEAKAQLVLKATAGAAPGVYPLRIHAASGQGLTAPVEARATWVLATDRSGTLATGETAQLWLIVAP